MSDVLTAKTRAALRALPGAYEQLKLFLEPGGRPADSGSRQRHGDSIRDPLVLAVEDLLNERVKPGTYPARIPGEIAGDEVWDPELEEWAPVRRQGILPTLSQWCRLVDAELWDAGIEHDEYGLLSCGRLCWLAPIRARNDNRAGPCSEDPQHHWNRPTVAGECSWLEPHLDWAADQPWYADLEKDLTQMLADVRVYVGADKLGKLECLDCTWPVAERDGGAWYVCTGCRRAWSRMELHRMAERRQPKTLAECAQLANVAERTLLRYVERGLISSVGRRGTAKLYDLEQVMEATMDLRYRASKAG